MTEIERLGLLLVLALAIILHRILRPDPKPMSILHAKTALADLIRDLAAGSTVPAEKWRSAMSVEAQLNRSVIVVRIAVGQSSLQGLPNTYRGVPLVFEESSSPGALVFNETVQTAEVRRS